MYLEKPRKGNQDEYHATICLIIDEINFLNNKIKTLVAAVEECKSKQKSSSSRKKASSKKSKTTQKDTTE